MLKLLKLSATNFKNYETMKLDFSNLNNVNVIQGENGLGKTSILDAISYALFGSTTNGNSGDVLVNRQATKNMYVTLEFQLDKHVYRIERYRKHSKHKNQVLLFKDNEDISKPRIKDTNDYIVDLIGFDYALFKAVIIFNATTSNTFVGGSDKDRKLILNELLNLDKFDQALAEAKEETKQVKSNVDTLVQKRTILKESQSNNNQLKAQYNLLKKQWEDNYSNLEKKYSTLEEDISSTKDIDTKRIPELNNKILDLTQQVSNLQGTNNTNTLISEVSSIESKLSILKTKGENAKQEVLKAKADYTSILNSETPTCLYCGNPLDDSHKQQELDRLKKVGSENLDIYNKALSEYKELSNKLSQKKAMLAEEQQKSSKLLEQANSLNAKLRQAQSELQTIEQQTQELNKKKIELHNLDDELVYLENNKPTPPDIKDVDKELSKLEEDLDKENQELHVLNESVNIFNNKGLKNVYIDGSLPSINASFKEYLGILSDGTMEAQLVTQTTNKSGKTSNKLNIELSYPSRGDNITFDELSSGEKRIVSLSLLLSFNEFWQKNNSLKLLLLDEVFDTLSSNRIHNVFKLLDTIKDKYDYIFIISHLDSLQNDYNRISIMKNNRGQSILNNE